MNFKIKYPKVEVNKFWQKLFDQLQLKFKNQPCLREREEA